MIGKLISTLCFVSSVFFLALPFQAKKTTSNPAASAFLLWNQEKPVPTSAEAPLFKNVRFNMIKEHEPQVDGYDWQHGVAIAFHKGVLYAAWGANKGEENSPGEVVLVRTSRDDGRTWSQVRMLAAGDSDRAASHGAFLSYHGTLWAFVCRFRGMRKDIQMEVYRLDEKKNQWVSGSIVDGGFWPLATPIRMNDGNWIMAGAILNGENPGAVAISHGNNFLKWDIVTIPKPPNMTMWGETAVIVNGKQVTAITRYGAKALALGALSNDYGRTWTVSNESNLPMTTSKPYAGILSTGQRYLICTTTADSGKHRWPLTIAVSSTSEGLFSKVYRIRDGVAPHDEDKKPAALSYPYAFERKGKLYISYSVGHLGGNRNALELAVIPVAAFSGGE